MIDPIRQVKWQLDTIWNHADMIRLGRLFFKLKLKFLKSF